MAVLQNSKHEAVLQAFLADAERVGWRAYQKIYPDASQRAAETAWSRLQKKAEFSARLAELNAVVTAEVVERATITKLDVINELAAIGFANMLDYARVTPDGEPFIDLSRMTRRQAAAVKQFTVEDFKDGRGEGARDVRKVTFHLHDKRAALVDIGKHLGIFTAGAEDPKDDPANDPAIKELSPIELARRVAFTLERGVRAKPAATPDVRVAAKPARTPTKKKGETK